MSRLLPRALELRAQEILDFSPILTLQGARQVGKSTLAQMLAKDRPAQVVTLDDSGVLAAARRDPRGFVDQAGERTLVIDEVQRMPELTIAVKASVDRDRRPGRFILTGSSDLARVRGDKDSLAGRAMGLHVFPLSQAEAEGLEPRGFVDRLLADGPDLDALQSAQPIARGELITRIVRGGYPAIRDANPRLHSRWLSDYTSRLLRIDTRDLGIRLNPARLEALLRLIAANQSGELVKARLAQEASLPTSSVTAYLDALSRLYMMETLRPWTPNLTTREIGRPKALVADSGLAARLIGASAAALDDVVAGAKTLGALLEGFVASELRAQQEWADADYELFHWRDRSGKEVDIIIELADGSVIALEVKSSQSLQARHFTGLDFLRERLGDRLRAGIVLACLDTPLRYGPGLWGLPITALWR
ncbi:ATP-binding protein [Actinomyces slackii]|uniref:Archaeal ATPase n=1 Tax=Actinomyces slackii TaxID=52774 RepID=A0A448KAS0_9ACTO|nr:ATP-binding protein [Actinomyces slackii]VEG74017.1 Uncharacterised protein [Actinomyces slackii]